MDFSIVKSFLFETEALKNVNSLIQFNSLNLKFNLSSKTKKSLYSTIDSSDLFFLIFAKLIPILTEKVLLGISREK